MAQQTEKKPPKARKSKTEPASELWGNAFANVDDGPESKYWIAYLDTATAQFKELKRFSYGLLELKPGDAVLDVGCGTGDDLRELAAMLGPEGLAIGVDSSRKMIGEARRRADGKGLEVEFLAADAQRLDLAKDSFNACRADRLLQHVSDPAQVLKEMVRVALPDAVVQVIDRDWEMLAVDAADRATTRVILNRICDGIPNGWIGRRLPALFRDCGLKDVRTSAIPVATGDLKIANTMLDLEVVAKRARDDGAITAASATAWLRDLKERDKHRRFFACWVIFVVTGRKSK